MTTIIHHLVKFYNHDLNQLYLTTGYKVKYKSYENMLNLF